MPVSKVYPYAVNERLTRMGLVGLGLVHELNTPLTMSALALELLGERLEGPNPPSPTDAAAEIERVLGQIQRMSELVQRLRSLARGHAGQRSAVSLDAVIDGVFQLARPTLNEIGRVRLVRGARTDAAPIDTDQLLLEQAVLLLVFNAAEAADGPDGAVCLQAESDAIVVRDNGPGFADLSAAQSLGTSSKGTMGIGLNFAELIITELGGKLHLGNHPKGGAVARVDLRQSA